MAESKERRAEGELLPSTSGRGAGGEGRGQRAESKERRAESGASDHPAKGAGPGLRTRQNFSLGPKARHSALRSPFSALRTPLFALRSSLSALRSPLSAHLSHLISASCSGFSLHPIGCFGDFLRKRPVELVLPQNSPLEEGLQFNPWWVCMPEKSLKFAAFTLHRVI